MTVSRCARSMVEREDSGREKIEPECIVEAAQVVNTALGGATRLFASLRVCVCDVFHEPADVHDMLCSVLCMSCSN